MPVPRPAPFPNQPKPITFVDLRVTDVCMRGEFIDRAHVGTKVRVLVHNKGTKTYVPGTSPANVEMLLRWVTSTTPLLVYATESWPGLPIDTTLEPGSSVWLESTHPIPIAPEVYVARGAEWILTVDSSNVVPEGAAGEANNKFKVDAKLCDRRPTATPPLHRFSTVATEHGQSLVCPKSYDISAAPGEDGDYAAIRVSIPPFPFVATRVRYRLHNKPAGGVPRSAALDHQIVLFVGSSSGPPSNPQFLRTQAVAGIDTDDAVVERVVDLDVPLELPTGKQLYVGIQMHVDATKALSLATCGHIITNDQVYWASDAVPPYTWADVSGWGTPLVQVEGFFF